MKEIPDCSEQTGPPLQHLNGCSGAPVIPRFHTGCLLFLGPRDIFAGTGIHLDHLPCLNEQRHTNNGTGLQGGGLTPTARGIPLQAGVGFSDAENDKVGWLDNDWTSVPQGYRADILLFQPLGGFTHRFGIGTHLLKGVIVHEVPEFTVVIEILHSHLHNIGCLNRLPRLEGLFNDATGLQVPDLHPIEGLTFTRLYKFVFNNGARVAIEHDLQSTLELIGAITCHLFLTRNNRLETRMIHRTGPSWQTPSWQQELASAFTDVESLLKYLGLDLSQLPAVRAAARKFPLRVPRDYAALIKKGDPDDPLLRQILPLTDELEQVEGFSLDPVGDLNARNAPGMIQKYQGRALLITTGACGINCRFCFRRNFPYSESRTTREQWHESLEYLIHNKEITEIILSGGDPLTLSDHRLKELIQDLGEISHLKRLRIHTRLIVTLPQRLTDQLLSTLSRTRLQAVMVVHVNHPTELSKPTRDVLHELGKAGIVMLNQTVLLRGVNDSANTLARLSEALFESRVMPYYLHLLDRAQGTAHFEVSLDKVRAIYRELQKSLPGYLVPKLVSEQAGAPNKLLINA
jgi:EF-P beta-lysylation protein EpmB